jgi:threonyl-tRNA synthetase
LNSKLKLPSPPVLFTATNMSADGTINAAELRELFPQLRVDTDTRSDTLQSKVRDAELLKINYVVVIGDKEEENKTLAIRPRGKKPEFGVKRDKFFKALKEELDNRI